MWVNRLPEVNFTGVDAIHSLQAERVSRFHPQVPNGHMLDTPIYSLFSLYAFVVSRQCVKSLTLAQNLGLPS